MTVIDAIEAVEGAAKAARILAEGTDPNDGTFRQAMANLRRDMALLEKTVHEAQREERWNA